MKGIIRIKHDTILKVNSADSSTLDDHLKSECPAGSDIEIAAYVVKERHVKFTIADRKDDIKGRNTWYCYLPHCEVEFDGRTIWHGEEHKPDTDEDFSENGEQKDDPDRGRLIQIPGRKVYLGDPIYKDSNFKWFEATKNGTRIPENETIVKNIIQQAEYLDEFRDYIGKKPIVVTSWFRDRETNRKVGGASRSDHLTGRSTDIYCPSINIWKLQDIALSYWKLGGVGRGARKGFIHLSSDGWYRVWDY